MKNIHINNSYKTWKPRQMWFELENFCIDYDIIDPGYYLNRSYLSIYIEWWLHNILYYLTKPLCRWETFKSINLRCKDVDLEERR